MSDKPKAVMTEYHPVAPLAPHESPPAGPRTFTLEFHPAGNPTEPKLGADPSVIWDPDWKGGMWRVWYTTGNQTTSTVIAYAESENGVNWVIPNPTAPWPFQIAIYPTPGELSWDPRCETVTVLKNPKGPGYLAWYLGKSQGNLFQIGYATSPDGITWTKHTNNPVVYPTMEWEQPAKRTVVENGKTYIVYHGGCTEPSVLWDAEAQLFKMWYGADSFLPGKIPNPWGIKMAYATSNDGVNWTKHDQPVMLPGDDLNDWDYSMVSHINVCKIDNYFHCFYAGQNKIKDGSPYGIGHAYSQDGINWTKTTIAGPIIAGDPESSWRKDACGGPCAVLRYNALYLYFMGTNLPNQFMGTRMGLLVSMLQAPLQKTELLQANNEELKFLETLGILLDRQRGMHLNDSMARTLALQIVEGRLAKLRYTQIELEEHYDKSR